MILDELEFHEAAKLVWRGMSCDEAGEYACARRCDPATS